MSKRRSDEIDRGRRRFIGQAVAAAGGALLLGSCQGKLGTHATSDGGDSSTPEDLGLAADGARDGSVPPQEGSTPLQDGSSPGDHGNADSGGPVDEPPTPQCPLVLEEPDRPIPQDADIPLPKQPYRAPQRPATVLIVGEGGHATISAALAAAAAGNGIEVTKNVSETVTVNKQVTLLGRSATVTGGFVLAAAGAILDGFTIVATGSCGVEVTADNCQVSNNTIRGASSSGVSLDSTTGCKVAGNTISDCGGDGITITGCTKALVQDNICTACEFGIEMSESKQSVIFRNQCLKTTEMEMYVEHIECCVIKSNRLEHASYTHSGSVDVDGFGMRWGKDVVIDGNFSGEHYYGIKLYCCTNCKVVNNVSTRSGVPIRIGADPDPCTDILLKNNRAYNGTDNMLIHDSSRVTVAHNECYRGADASPDVNTYEGVYLQNMSTVTVTNNILHDVPYGVRIASSSDISVTNNQFCECSQNVASSGSTGVTESGNTDC